MSSSQKAKIALTLALVLLTLSGIAAGFVIYRLYANQALVQHTYEVEVAIGDMESSLTDVGRSRVAYDNGPTAEALGNFWKAVSSVGPALAKIRQLVRDNPTQLALTDRLEANANDRIAPSKESVELTSKNQSTPEKVMQLTRDVARASFDTSSITRVMKQNEDELLERRTRLSNVLFLTFLSILTVSFVLAALMFWLHYYLLNREFQERREAENQLRLLSVQLMRVQDEEHRRFARELHDGVGQTLAAAKMIVTSSSAGTLDIAKATDLAAMLDEAISQVRTISYLFHPPLLDEIGFTSAAKWLVEGFTQRTGLAIAANIPQPEKRMPANLELTLYRVLQEALNNIHRHSKSEKAEVSLRIDPDCVTMRVRDYGRGIPDDTLDTLRANGKQVGVGLLSMKERVREQHGELEIGSHAKGTEIVVKIPYETTEQYANSFTSDSGA
jgi:signal transduction histidine kinase